MLNSFDTWHFTDGTGFLNLIHFCVPTINWESVVPNICLKRGSQYFLPHDPAVGKMMPEFLWKQNFLESFTPVKHPKWLQNRNICWIFLIRRVVVRAGVNCPHLWLQLVLWLICSSLCWWWFVCVYEFYRSKGSSSSEDWQCVWRLGLELFGGIPQDNPEHGER